MFVLALALLVLFWIGVISDHAVLPLEVALTLPAMIVVMLDRFDEYAGHANGDSRRSDWESLGAAAGCFDAVCVR